MTSESILKNVQFQKPSLIYLSGKTCTGKSTLAHHLECYGYKKIELDKVVMRSVVVPFNVATGDGFRTAYRGDGPIEQTQAFVEAARLEIMEGFLSSPLVIEGAIADSRILSEIFSGDFKDFFFIYLHPVHTLVYQERILSRFVAGAATGNAGLPKDFWSLLPDFNLDQFKDTSSVTPAITDAVRTFAQKSMAESQLRLKNFKLTFPDIAVVEI